MIVLEIGRSDDGALGLIPAEHLSHSVLRLPVDVQVQAANVFTDDAQGQQLEATENQHRDNRGGIAGNGNSMK